MYFEIGENGKIMICAETPIKPNMLYAVPPSEFAEDKMHDWRMVDGVFVYDPSPDPEPKETIMGRVTALEEENKQLKEALYLLLSGVTEEGETGG